MNKYLILIAIILLIACIKEAKKTTSKVIISKSKKEFSKQTSTIENYDSILFETYSCRPR